MAARETCFHCGDLCDETPLTYDDHPFCCGGCQTVYQVLKENDLGTYYSLAERPGQKQAGGDAPLFAHLDEPEVVRAMADFVGPEYTTLTLRIPGIHCSSCIWLLENLHKLNPHVGTVEVNFPRKEATITYAHAQLRLSELSALLHKIGYSPRLSLDSTEQDNPRRRRIDRKLLYRLGIAGFAFGNIMLLSFPDYLDKGAVAHTYQQAFNWLNFLLALPVLFYSGWSYLHSAWVGMRHRRFVIDQPLALGMVAMMAISLWEILTHNGTGYFDSLAGLVFFLLLGKLFQAKTYAALAFDRDYKAYFPLSVLRKDAEGISHPTLVSKLQPGDHIIVRNQEVIPTDGILRSAQGGKVDYSFATGEEVPVAVTPGETLYAGGRVLGPALEVTVQKATQQSHLTKLWNHPAFKKTYRGTHSERLDNISKYFTIGILTVASAAGLYWSFIDTQTAIYAFTSVLIIACPCALALSTPFTFGHITRILGRNGLYLKQSAVVERLALANTLVFDKTGTLSKPQARNLRFGSSGLVLTDEMIGGIAAVAKQSTHPMSRMVVSHLKGYRTHAATQVQEVAGMGVEGEVNGMHIKLGNAEYAGVPLAQVSQDTSSQVYVTINGNYRGSFVVQAEYREGIEKLHPAQTGMDTHILSGDTDAEAVLLFKAFGDVPMSFRQKPDDKLAYIERLLAADKQVVMLGDGLNDAGALKAATVGIAVSDSAAMFTPAADAILEGKLLSRLPQLLRLSQHSLTIVKICTFVSLLYNVIGLSFAVQGILSPVVAAILMPASSIGIVILATLLSYRYARKLGLSVGLAIGDLK